MPCVGHFVPFPVENWTTCLARSCTPKQVELQADQSLQSETLQSWLCSQGGKALHISCSSSNPNAGLPHSEPCRSKSRCRDLVAGAHVAEHLLHSDQDPHLPSKHWWQESVLHVETSSLALASHIFPPYLGAVSMVRRLLFVPPPHVVVHALQGSQSPHLQSMGSQTFSMQAFVSLRAAVQPFVCPSEAMLLPRIETPWPQSVEHADQSIQGVQTQASVQHACEPQAPVSRMLGMCLKPSRTQRSKFTMCRVLSLWPWQVAVQPDHSVQSDNSQSPGGARFFTGQPWVSSSWWLQRAASPMAGINTDRLRYFWNLLLALHPSQSVQASRTHAEGSTQGCTLHACASRIGSPSP
mmetsp:Transcript_46836/g.134923  ORF Transcript_46836/g.134923 Transcript_46836/m.134923 type:complete len:353 (-) Transcript_46836:191-1249(-)